MTHQHSSSCVVVFGRGLLLRNLHCLNITIVTKAIRTWTAQGTLAINVFTEILREIQASFWSMAPFLFVSVITSVIVVTLQRFGFIQISSGMKVGALWIPHDPIQFSRIGGGHLIAVCFTNLLVTRKSCAYSERLVSGNAAAQW